MRPVHLVAILVLLALILPASPAQAGGGVSVCDESHLLSALSGGGTVTFSCSGTITLTNTITIAANTTIDGSGQAVIISGNKAVRVFKLNSGVTLSLKGLTVANGFVDLYDPTPRGAGILSSGGTLIIDNSIISGNYTLYGAGVYSSGGSVTVRDSNFAGNYTYSTLDSHGGGSGIYIVGGALDVVNSTFSGNDNDGQGGGVYLGAGTVTVSNSTFSGNSASEGGGIYAPSGTLNVSNSTFSGNFAWLLGGGISIGNTYLTVSNSTFSGNTATLGGASVNSGGTAILRNTIAANSSGGKECRGLITDGGGNLGYPDSTCPGIHLNPLLGPLQENGGPTKTMALGAGSPAIDAANDAICAAAPINNLDQRGVARPQGAHCDIGAFEQQVLTLPHPISIDIKPGSDANSINCRNANEVIAVAILSTDAFDAATVDHTTVGFEGTGETHVDKKTGEPKRHEEDVDGDGDMDLVFHFRLGDTHLTCASTEAALRGETNEGQPILGADFVRMVGGG
jgi:predicted outer membrane repeat protein